jgi:hypothetical protein
MSVFSAVERRVGPSKRLSFASRGDQVCNKHPQQPQCPVEFGDMESLARGSETLVRQCVSQPPLVPGVLKSAFRVVEYGHLNA